MMCNTKTMLKVGSAMLVAVGIAYAALPEFRGWILAMSPTLLFLLCPLSMIFCMKMMHGQNGQSCGTQSADKKEALPNASGNVESTKS